MTNVSKQVLQVKGYRGLRSFRVDPVADVNLFLGRNNVGKTSVLEAVQLARSRSPIGSLRSNALRRREIRFLDPDAERAYRYNWVDLSHAYWGRVLRPGAQIEVALKGSPSVTVTVESGDPGQGVLFEEGGPEFVLATRRGGQDVERVPISQEGVLPELQRRPASLPKMPEQDLFLTTEGLEGQRLAVLFNEVTLRGEENLLVEALRILDERVRGVHVLTNPSGLEPLVLLDRNGAGRQPVGSFGDGMKRLLTLAVAIVNSANGTLQIDEIDTGLHHSVLQQMWTLVLHSSRDRRVQLFATTHSHDCIQALRWALEVDPEQADRVAVHKVVADQEKAISFTGAELLVALQHDVELR